jgi:alkylation response protein AidB-like acyl-CoA dehydrogenase
MTLQSTPQQQERQQAFKSFVSKTVLPHADTYDREEYTPPTLIREIAQEGYLGALIPKQWHGLEMDMITFGLLNEELGRGCSSLRSLLTVHSMVAHAILRWGSKQQKEHWLPKLATGEVVGAFGLSEPNVGSDARSIETKAELRGDTYILNGVKKWTTYGQIADLFLIFARCDDQISAFLVARDTPGLVVQPLHGMLGTRASMLAELHLSDCHIAKEMLVGGRGFGLASVAQSSLDIGRYSVAWGCVGLAQRCLELSLEYASTRKQFGVYLREHQLVQQMLADMITQIKAARLLCLQAGHSKTIGTPETIMETWIAKYFASTTATKVANNAVQIHGANGCSADYSVQRYLRDARIMEIIEGSTQIQQITIAQYGYQ